jgi:HEAT repeat protein
VPNNSNPKHNFSQAGDPQVRRAFEALKSYGPGSSRGELQLIDNAVIASLREAGAGKELENQLIRALGESKSVVAREFICSKLALLGTDKSVSALAQLLMDESLSTAARNALQSIPSSQAAKAFRASLEKVKGPEKIGLINSLGLRRDEASLRVLTNLLKDANGAVVAAALAAIGEIGSPRAATILRGFQSRGPASFLQALTDASLVCAERLLAAGQKGAAASLYKSLDCLEQPQYIKQALGRGLSSAAG